MNFEEYSKAMTRRQFIRQAACAAVGTIAVTSTISDLRLINAALAQSYIPDYKAMVCIFLSGGNDSNNLLIPTTSSEYASYARIRTPVLALANDGSPNSILPLKGTDSEGRTYAIHPACPELQSLFNAGKVAGIFNVGTLVYPLTRAQFDSNSVPRPSALMSHGDQQEQWQTSFSDRVSPTGWGGRCADLLNTLNPKNQGHDRLSLAISLAGNNIFEVGGVAKPYIINAQGPQQLAAGSTAPGLSARLARVKAMQDIVGLNEVHQNMLVQNYSLALDHSLEIGSTLSTALASSQLENYWSTSYPETFILPNSDGRTVESSLQKQLKMVAKIIEAGYKSEASGGLGMRRQIFFCQVGGYDTHFNQTTNSANNDVTAAQAASGTQANLLAEVSQAMSQFQSAVGKIGQFYNDSNFENRVTTFTASDFGRSLACNGLGSDHGWGGHHLIMGGAVAGGKTYGKFPLLAVNGPDDVGLGRWLPTTSVDQFAATIARWFGVNDSQMDIVFPNLKRFSTPNLGFMKA